MAEVQGYFIRLNSAINTLSSNLDNNLSILAMEAELENLIGTLNPAMTIAFYNRILKESYPAYKYDDDRPFFEE